MPVFPTLIDPSGLDALFDSRRESRPVNVSLQQEERADAFKNDLCSSQAVTATNRSFNARQHDCRGFFGRAAFDNDATDSAQEQQNWRCRIGHDVELRSHLTQRSLALEFEFDYRR